MKLMIASDIHGAAGYCGEMLKRFEEEKADRLLLLGDLLYHGPRNDLPDGYAPKQVIALLNAVKDRLFCVRGNCEAEVDQMVLDFPVMAEYALLPQDHFLIYATHGHHAGETNLPPLNLGDVLLTGHTHVPALKELGSVMYMNPGSVSIPKGGSSRGYMTLENGLFLWKTLDGQTWREYRK